MPPGATSQENKYSRGLAADRVGSAPPINSTADIENTRQSLGIRGGDNKKSIKQRLGGSLDNRLDSSIRSHEDREGQRSQTFQAAKEQALKRGLSQSKASGAGAAAEALARGEGGRAAADKGLAAAAQAKKIQNFRLILAAIRGGAAITVVGIIVTILIWGLQLLRGHLLGNDAWKMSNLELMLAVPIWIVLLALLTALLLLMVMLTTSYFKIIGWIFF